MLDRRTYIKDHIIIFSFHIVYFVLLWRPMGPRVAEFESVPTFSDVELLPLWSFGNLMEWKPLLKLKL